MRYRENKKGVARTYLLEESDNVIIPLCRPFPILMSRLLSRNSYSISPEVLFTLWSQPGPRSDP